MNKIKHIIQNGRNWFLNASLLQKAGVLIVTGLIFFGGYKGVMGQQSTTQYQTAPIDRGSVISTVTESGNVASGSQTNITSPTNGIVEDLYVANGAVVNAGDALFRVKSTATPQEKAAAYATYLAAITSQKTAGQTKLTTQAQLEADRQAVLDAQNAVDYKNNNTTNPSTKKDYTDLEKQSIDSALTKARQTFSADEKKYLETDNSINSTGAQVTSAWLAYQETQDADVVAPVSGTVANLAVAIGSSVSASSGNTTTTTSTTATPAMVIGNFANLSVKVQVSEVDVPKIKPGQKATITLDAFPDKTYVGAVSNIDTVGISTSGVVTYGAYISLLYAPPGVQPGMTASATIQIARKDDVLKVPTGAVQTNNGQSFVRLMKKNQVTQANVETGISSDTETEIVSGVSEGDTVITGSTSTSSNSSTQTSSPFGGLGGRGGFGGTQRRPGG